MVAADAYFVIDTNSRPIPDGEHKLMRRYQRSLRAKYDAAALSPQMENWWANADSSSPRAAASKAARKRIRERARYEVHESGSYANGILQAMVNAVIGCGPTLQVKTDNKALNEAIELEWAKYTREIRFVEKLRTMFAAKLVDGEAFAERVFNPRLQHPVKFDWIISEADLWTNPLDGIDPDEDDGIEFDRLGNPTAYRRLRQHPGDPDFYAGSLETDRIDPRYVLHWFCASRPGQRRGVSEFASSLQPLARLRRYQLAVQAAADTAANHAAVMYSTASAFSELPAEIDEENILQTVPLTNNAMLTLPEGWQIQQLKAEQPHTEYVQFVEERIAAAARPFQMPLNVAIGSSRNHNFASAKLDWMQFKRANEPKRKDCEDQVLNKIAGAWLWAAARSPGYLPGFDAETLLPEIPITWQWPIDDPIDIESQANADQKYWSMGLMTDAAFCKRNGIDEEDFYDQLKRQNDRRAAIGESAPMPGVQMSKAFQQEPQQ